MQSNQLQLDKKLLLAPMAGVNDPIFRSICKRFGAFLTYSEMISAKGLEYGSAKTFNMLSYEENEPPLAVQLFGKDPKSLAEQAFQLEQKLADSLALIDINMACPARKLISKGEGAALLKQPQLAARIISDVVNATTKPVTIKIRKGFNVNDDVAVQFAQIAQECGAAAVAIHGRSAAQMYHGRADREVVRVLKHSVSIPVIATGDVFSSEDIRSYLQDYNADAIMIARGAQGNPWIFAGLKPTFEQRIKIAREHTLRLANLMPRRLSSMRKHISWYLKGMPDASAIRKAVNSCVLLSDYEKFFLQIKAGLGQ
ncbi:MAG: tRNA dihydrouridine synthase DusB [Coriobacteriales bacterium]|nr:tRNA dihydrouridine synthase DusB [Coriobacteriales bacterium]